MPEAIPDAPPPEGFQRVRDWVLDGTEDLSSLRRSLHQAITGSTQSTGEGLAEVPERVVLVASELATNALRHGLAPTTVTLLTDGTNYVLDVADHDLQNEPFIPNDRAPGDGGLGLRMTWALTEDMGWYTTAETKHVWARFPCTAGAKNVTI